MSLDKSKFNLESSNLPIGSIIPSIEALHWSHKSDCDIRPRLVDKSTGEARLVDSGSMISVTKKEPDDKIDNSIRLIAVNGSRIDAYGVRNIEFKIGRKSYKMPAVICDVKQDILGQDFVDKFKMGFEWDDVDQSEYFIVDKRAKIKAKLQIVTVASDLPRVHYLEHPSESASPSSQGDINSGNSQVSSSPSGEAFLPRLDNQSIEFQVSCMKRLAEEEDQQESVENQLKQHDQEYVQLIKEFPQLLNQSFVKGEPAHGVYHKIETGDHPPCKAKRRPIINNSARAAAGKKAWDQMIKDGIVEKVKAGTNTDWSSALHIVDISLEAEPGRARISDCLIS